MGHTYTGRGSVWTVSDLERTPFSWWVHLVAMGVSLRVGMPGNYRP